MTACACSTTRTFWPEPDGDMTLLIDDIAERTRAGEVAPHLRRDVHVDGLIPQTPPVHFPQGEPPAHP